MPPGFRLNHGCSTVCKVGDFKDSKRHGLGTYFAPTAALGGSGAVFVGEYRQDRMDGVGTYYHGVKQQEWREISRYAHNRAIGEGALFAADLRSACRLVDGKPTEWVSLEEAAHIAAALGLPPLPAKKPEPPQAPSSR